MKMRLLEQFIYIHTIYIQDRYIMGERGSQTPIFDSIDILLCYIALLCNVLTLQLSRLPNGTQGVPKRNTYQFRVISGAIITCIRDGGAKKVSKYLLIYNRCLVRLNSQRYCWARCKITETGGALVHMRLACDKRHWLPTMSTRLTQEALMATTTGQLEKLPWEAIIGYLTETLGTIAAMHPHTAHEKTGQADG
jgi:hypothetical protein